MSETLGAKPRRTWMDMLLLAGIFPSAEGLPSLNVQQLRERRRRTGRSAKAYAKTDGNGRLEQLGGANKLGRQFARRRKWHDKWRWLMLRHCRYEPGKRGAP